jgi:hypothetical protein
LTNHHYSQGFSEARLIENQQNVFKRLYNANTEASWFCIHYADFLSKDASFEPCESYEEAVQIILKKPKRSDIAY